MVVVGEEEAGILRDIRDLAATVSFGGLNDTDVKVRDLPKVGEVLDQLPCVLVALQDMDSEPLDMEGGANRRTRVEVCLVDAHDGDFANDVASRLAWRKRVVNVLEFTGGGEWRLTLPSVPSVWSVRPARIAGMDRSKLNDGYAYFSIVFEVWSQE